MGTMVPPDLSSSGVQSSPGRSCINATCTRKERLYTMSVLRP